jgi:hypothetical protein
MSDFSDPSDMATFRETQDREGAIAAARRASELAAARPLPTECDNGCGEAPRERSRYCSSECREDHEARISRAKRLGVR